MCFQMLRLILTVHMSALYPFLLIKMRNLNAEYFLYVWYLFFLHSLFLTVLFVYCHVIFFIYLD